MAHSFPQSSDTTIDAVNEATIFIGRMVTSDGGSHTVDTTGSSSIGWRTGSITFSNGGTTVKVGIAPVDMTNGPPGRASNTTNAINFDVAAVFTGGGGGITGTEWQTSVPTTGTKTIANGDLVAVAVQMTARGGADSIIVRTGLSGAAINMPVVTLFTGGFYTAVGSRTPNCFITFSDGATGYIFGSDVFSFISPITWNSGSATKEYGQLFQFPHPVKIYGIWGWADFDNNCDLVLYSDPLGGSPVAEKTITVDANTVAGATGVWFQEMFSSPYYCDAYEKVGAVFKPGASNVSAYYKILGAAGQRVSDPWGANGYGISRASGAFADINSSKDTFYIGLIVGAFTHGRTGGHLGV
jgi:hypothetical protein